MGSRDDSYLNALKELQSTAQQQDEKVAALLLKRKEDAEIERKWGSKGDSRKFLLLDADQGKDLETKETDHQEADDAQWFSDDEDENSPARPDNSEPAPEPEVIPTRIVRNLKSEVHHRASSFAPACGHAILPGISEIQRYCPFSLALTRARHPEFEVFITYYLKETLLFFLFSCMYIQHIKTLELTVLGRTLHVNEAMFDKFAVLDDHAQGAAADSKRFRV